MFGIGMPELILIAVVALIVLGPKKLPELAKSMGRAVREFRKATSELKESFQIDSEINEARKTFNEFHAEVNRSVQKEATRPETPAESDAAPPAVSPAPAPVAGPVEPSSAVKVEELNKAFEAWNAEKTLPPKAPDSPAPDPTPADKPKSA